MEIVVVGGGKLGEELCRDLNNEGHNITLIDNDRTVLNRLVEDIDIKGVYGSGTDLEVQREADVESSRVFIAVTQSDDVNLISSVLADKLGASYILCRIQDNAYIKNEVFIRKNLGIDYMINQAKQAAQDIIHVLDYPTASYVEPFNQGKAHLIKIRVYPHSQLVGMQVSEIREEIENLIICVIERDFKTVIPKGDTMIAADDFIDVIASRAALDELCIMAGHQKYDRFRSAFVIGGSRINQHLLPALHTRGIQAKIIEIKPERAHELAIQFPNFEIIIGDGTDQDFLLEQRLHNYDVAIGLTDSDEENLMFALFAADLGVKKNITKVNRPNLIKLLSADKLDVIISPRKSISDAIVRRVRSLDQNFDNHLFGYATLATEKTEVLEFQVTAEDQVTRFNIMDMRLKEGVIIGLIIRDGQKIIPAGADQLQAEDHVIIINLGEKINKIDDILTKHKRGS